MFSISRITRTAPPYFAALALFCAVTALGPDPARAQTAKDLDCKKCVDSDDVAKKAVTKSRIEKEAISENRIKDGAVEMARLSTGLQDHVGEREPFYIVLDGNSTQTIATHGPLTYLARCLPEQPDGSGGLQDRVEIVATSSLSGWLEADEHDDEFGGNVPFAAGQEEVVKDETVNPSGGALYDDLTETAIVTPDGSYLAIQSDSSGIGLNVFGHDCVVVGNIHRLTGTL